MNKQKATRKHVQGEDYVGRCPQIFILKDLKEKSMDGQEKMKNEELYNDQQVEVKV